MFAFVSAVAKSHSRHAVRTRRATNGIRRASGFLSSTRAVGRLLVFSVLAISISIADPGKRNAEPALDAVKLHRRTDRSRMCHCTIGFVRLVLAIRLAVAHGRTRDALVLVRADVVRIRHASVRRAGAGLVRSVLAILVSVADKVRRNATAVGALELVTGAADFGRHVAAVLFVLAESAVGDSIASVLGWNAAGYASEPLLSETVGRGADAVIIRHGFPNWTKAFGFFRCRDANVAAATRMTDVFVLLEIEVIDYCHQSVLDRNVVGSVDDESAHRFRFLLVEPADSGGELSQPENRVGTGVHSNRCAEMRAKNCAVLPVDFDAFDGATKRVAEVKVFAVERHGRNSSVDLDQFLTPTAIHVPDADDMTDASFDDKHQTKLGCKRDSFGAVEFACQDHTLVVSVVIFMANHDSSLGNFGPVDVFSVGVDVQTFDRVRVFEKDRLTKRLQMHRVNGPLAHVAVNDRVTQRVEGQGSDVFHIASWQANDGILADLVMSQSVNVGEGRDDDRRCLGGVVIASAVVSVQHHARRTSAFETFLGRSEKAKMTAKDVSARIWNVDLLGRMVDVNASRCQ